MHDTNRLGALPSDRATRASHGAAARLHHSASVTSATQHVIRATVLGQIADERRRQIEAEGWSAEHDDTHAGGELAAAASCYARGGAGLFSLSWPFEGEPKFKDRRSDLIRAGALIVAEIERLDRASAIEAGTDETLKAAQPAGQERDPQGDAHPPHGDS